MSMRACAVLAAIVVSASGAGAWGQCTVAWDGGVGVPGVNNGYAGPMAVWNDGTGEKLFVGGSFTTLANQQIRGIGRWNPTTRTWSAVAGGVFSQFTNYFAAAVQAHEGALFVGGSFATAGNVAGTQNIARFNGTSWSSLGPALNGAVWSFASWNGTLYVGGGFTMAGAATVNGITAYDGKGYTPVGSGFGGGFSPGVFAMKVFNDGSGEKLYVGGRFSSMGGVNGMIARWNGASFEAVGTGILAGGTFADIEAMAVFDPDGSGPEPAALYVGGSELVVPGHASCSVARWNGVSWAPVGQNMGGRTTSLAAFDDGSGPALFSAGTAQPGISYFARLNGNTWSAAYGGVGGTAIPPSNFPSVFGLLAWGERLVVAGNFTRVGSANLLANGVAFVQGCPVCRADFNDDGGVNSQDFFDFLAAFFAGNPSADFNGDAAVNSQDFFDFVGAFFVGC